MKVHLDCYPCFLKQTIIATRLGTILEWTSRDFQNTFENATFIISKGQGNFETLTGSKKTIFYLFQSKCDVVSKELGLSKSSMLLKKS